MADGAEPLTKKTILALPAGPEIDALVAERVFGLKLHREETGYGFPGQMEDVWRDEQGYKINLTDFSTRIRDAWEIVWKVTARKCDTFSHGVMLDLSGPNPHFTAVFHSLEIGEESYFSARATGQTAALAICRAALLLEIEWPTRTKSPTR